MEDRTPGCYAVIFTSRLAEDAGDTYDEMANRMTTLARAQPGFLGLESARGLDGLGITVSYWDSMDAILAWKNHPEHIAAREAGRNRWYSSFVTRVARVERAYAMGEPPAEPPS